MSYNGKQMIMAFTNKLYCDNIIIEIKNDSHIEYYICYLDNNIKDYYFVYFQSPKIPFHFTKKYKQFYYFYFRNRSILIYEFIKNKCTIINEEGKFNRLRTNNLLRELNNDEISDINSIKEKIDNFYKKENNLINKTNDGIVTDIETENEDVIIKKKDFRPSFKKNIPLIVSNTNNINIDLWKTNLNYDIKQIKVVYFYGFSDIDKTDKIKEFIKNEDYGNIINVVKYDGEYWYGIGDAHIAVYDNFREKQLNIFELLEFIDNEVHFLKTKNGNVKNNYQLIIFNSIENIQFSYLNIPDDLKHKLLSSIKIIKC